MKPDSSSVTGRSIGRRFDFAAALGRWSGLFSPQIEGFVDRIVGDEAYGWAFDRRRPNRRVMVVAVLDGTVVGECLADLPRRDLQGRNQGDGRCGFRLKLPANLGDSARATLKVVGCAGLRRRALKYAKRFRHEPLADRSADLERSRAPRVGFLERLKNGVLEGWAVDPNNPETPATVDVFDGEIFLGCATANIDRPRLVESGAPFGARGFEFRMPEGRAAPPERLRARIGGSRFDLRKSKAFAAEEALGGREDIEAASTGPNPPTEGAHFPPAVESTRSGALFIICGSGPAANSTEEACRSQSLAETKCIIASAEGRGGSGQEPPDSELEAELKLSIRRAKATVFLPMGAIPAASLAEMAVSDETLDDILWWEDAAAPSLLPNPTAAVLLGGRTLGLCVRAQVAGPLADELASAVLQGGMDALEVMLPNHSLKWRRVEEGLASTASPSSSSRPLTLQALEPRRLSLAIWGGWELGAPPALAGLLAAASRYQLEVLAPATAPDLDGLMDRLRSVNATLRLADVDRATGALAPWQVMARAATGEVVLLSDGRQSAGLNHIGVAAQLSIRPDVGAVRLCAGDAETTAGPVPPLAVVSRSVIAEMPVIDSRLGEDDVATLENRLRETGRTLVVLDCGSAAPLASRRRGGVQAQSDLSGF